MTGPLIELLRLAHALSAAVWFGGVFVCYLLRRGTAADLGPRLWAPLRESMRATIGVFLVTGAFLAVQRLSSATLPPTYFGVLALKVALALVMFGVARRVAVGSGPLVGWSPEVIVLSMGVAIYALAIALRAIYEDTIRLAA